MPGPDNNPQDQVMIYIQLRRIIKTKIFIFLLQKAAEELTDGETAACCCLLCMGASCWVGVPVVVLLLWMLWTLW